MSEELTSTERAESSEQQNEIFLRRKKLEDLKAAGRDPFTIVKYDRDSLAAQIKADFASYENKEVSVAGRIMSRRIMGKASFATIADNSGTKMSYV